MNAEDKLMPYQIYIKTSGIFICFNISLAGNSDRLKKTLFDCLV